MITEKKSSKLLEQIMIKKSITINIIIFLYNNNNKIDINNEFYVQLLLQTTGLGLDVNYNKLKMPIVTLLGLTPYLKSQYCNYHDKPHGTAHL